MAPIYNEGKIKNIGLTPKTKNPLTKHPDRVYLLRGSAGEEYVKALGSALHVNNNSDYTVFILDTNKVCDKAKLFEDPQSNMGLWTYNNIPPNAIVGIKHLEFDKDNNVKLY